MKWFFGLFSKTEPAQRMPRIFEFSEEDMPKLLELWDEEDKAKRTGAHGVTKYRLWSFVKERFPEVDNREAWELEKTSSLHAVVREVTK